MNAVLGFKVIHEIFPRRVPSLSHAERPGHSAVQVGGSGHDAGFSGGSLFEFPRQGPLVHAVTTLQRSVLIVQLGLILFMLLFSRFLGVSRKQISFGISFGFGLSLVLN